MRYNLVATLEPRANNRAVKAAIKKAGGLSLNETDFVIDKAAKLSKIKGIERVVVIVVTERAVGVWRKGIKS